MIETRLRIDGMMCSMCEAHLNDAVRKAIPVRKVSSSHTKGETVLVTEEAVDEQALRKAVEATGYRVLSVSAAPYEKKGFFGIFR